MSRSHVRALGAAFASGWKERLRYPADVLGAAVFLGLLVFVFSRLWNAIASQGAMPGGWSTSSLVLYLVITELVMMGPGALHHRIGSQVRSGDLAVQLLRPVGWIPWELASAAGAACARIVVLAAAGLAVATAVAGLPRLEAGSVAAAALVLPLAVLFECAARLLVGVLAFWTEDSGAFYWIWQKLGFVLGGLLMPLDLYPPWLQSVARVLPFEAVLGAPARLLAAPDPSLVAGTIGRLAGWTVVIVLALVLVHGRAVRSVQINGG